jgi:SAM-dependent MidA family methyltransferase
LVHRAIAQAGGWLPFDRFMALALYAPGLGYYANGLRKFGTLPSSGSDFVTAPELSPLFGRALAVQVARRCRPPAPARCGSLALAPGALALQLLAALGDEVERYTIVDLSGSLRERQQHAGRLRAPGAVGQ